ncbi:MAG: hypothetical protein KDB18_12080, partial [Salinibacterium sp.]|nr:hypothetical protein [Salinibacterium sp.]
MKRYTRATLIALAAGGLCSQAVLADTINVPTVFATIQGAINAAATTGDTIIVAPGTYNENIDFIGKSIALMSSGGSGSTTINGTFGATSTITMLGSGAGTSISGFTIVAGLGQADPFDALSTSGGGMFVQDSIADFDDLVVRDGVTTGRGGGAHFIDSELNI